MQVRQLKSRLVWGNFTQAADSDVHLSWMGWWTNPNWVELQEAALNNDWFTGGDHLPMLLACELQQNTNLCAKPGATLMKKYYQASENHKSIGRMIYIPSKYIWNIVSRKYPPLKKQKEDKHPTNKQKNMSYTTSRPILYGGFLKWWYPQNTPKMIIFSGKTHGCWVPPFKETPIYTT